MKYQLLLSLLLLTDFSLSSPLFPRLEDVDSNPRWSLIPDADGNMHLVDLNPYEMSVEPHFDAVRDTTFLLFTRRNPTIGQTITWNLEVMRNSNFDPNHPTRFTVHGWNGDRNARVNTHVSAGYFRYGDYNMITVDWSLGGSTLNYITARNRVGAVADVMAGFIDFLHEHNFLRFDRLHVVGHSLGGQIVGLTGKAVRRGKIQAVIALDPAGPLFSVNNPNERVSPTDGVYVEVIHTNMGRLGFSEPIGQADFFPNYGIVMPGCESDITGQCSHSLSHVYYAETINAMFTGQECSSFADIVNEHCISTGRTGRMGGPHEKIGLTGVFYLATNIESPFSRG